MGPSLPLVIADFVFVEATVFLGSGAVAMSFSRSMCSSHEDPPEGQSISAEGLSVNGEKGDCFERLGADRDLDLASASTLIRFGGRQSRFNGDRREMFDRVANAFARHRYGEHRPLVFRVSVEVAFGVKIISEKLMRLFQEAHEFVHFVLIESHDAALD